MVVSFTGCGDNVSKREAERGWRSTQTSMARAGVGLSVSGVVSGNGVSGMATGTFDCPDGGTVEVSTEGEVTSMSVDASLSLEFFGCKADKVVTDGVLDYEAHVSQEEVSASYTGELEWSGRAKGRCIVEAEARISTTGISASFKGDVCGYSWNDIR